MAWPPPVLPTNRDNATGQQNTHPADHNAANMAINDIVVHQQQQDAADVTQSNDIAAIANRVLRLERPNPYSKANSPDATNVGPGIVLGIPMGPGATNVNDPYGMIWDGGFVCPADFGGNYLFTVIYRVGRNVVQSMIDLWTEDQWSQRQGNVQNVTTYTDRDLLIESSSIIPMAPTHTVVFRAFLYGGGPMTIGVNVTAVRLGA